MKKQIDIEADGKMSLVLPNEKHTYKPQDAEKVLQQIGMAGFIPPYVRWADPANETYLLEFPPTYHIITSGTGKKYRIPVPWQVYICKPPNWLQFFVRPAQLKSLDDPVYYGHMSNVYRDCSPCSGASMGRGVNPKEPLQRCTAMITYLWSTTFNGGCYLAEGSYKNYHSFPEEKRSNLFPKELQKKWGNNMWPMNHSSDRMWDMMEKYTAHDLLSWEWTEVPLKLPTLLERVPGKVSRLKKLEQLLMK